MIGVARALGLFDGAPKPAIVAHSFGASVALEALEQLPGGFAGAAICDMMALRPAMLEAFWAGGHTSPGSGNPDKDRKSVGSGKGVSLRGALCGPRVITQKTIQY